MPNEPNHNIYREYEGETLNAVLIVADIRRLVPFYNFLRYELPVIEWNVLTIPLERP
jgi:hypothetical protein